VKLVADPAAAPDRLHPATLVRSSDSSGRVTAMRQMNSDLWNMLSPISKNVKRMPQPPTGLRFGALSPH
jgi:hypothetical protein